MKKLYFTLALIIYSLIYAQVPQGFSYQTIAFDASGAPINNGSVSLKISILDNSATGTVLYSETHAKTTNAKGLVNLNIGQGTPVSGTFSGIDWGTNPKFIKVELDPTGGTNYINVGVNQLMSVPYALVAGSIDMTSSNSTIGDDIIENKNTNYLFIDKYDSKIFAYSSKVGTWLSQVYSSSYSDSGTTPYINSSNGSFSFIDKYDSKIYVFNSNTGTWTSQNYNINYSNSGTTPALNSNNGIFTFIDKYESRVYIFNSKKGIWTSQNYNINYSNSGTTPSIKLSDFNYMFIDKYDSKVYVFNSTTGTWSSQSYSINYFNTGVTPSVDDSTGNFTFIDKYDSKVYIFNSKKGVWTSQQYNKTYFNSGISPNIITSETN